MASEMLGKRKGRDKRWESEKKGKGEKYGGKGEREKKREQNKIV